MVCLIFGRVCVVEMGVIVSDCECVTDVCVSVPNNKDDV